MSALLDAKYLCFKADSSLSLIAVNIIYKTLGLLRLQSLKLFFRLFVGHLWHHIPSGSIFKAFFPDALVLSLHGYLAYLPS